MTMTMTERMTPMQARRITANLIIEHGLTGWRFTTDNAKRRAGVCKYRERVISLSSYLMDQRSYEDTLNTITHEVAHAIVGAGHDHDYVWARKHREVGGDGKRGLESFDDKATGVGT